MAVRVTIEAWKDEGDPKIHIKLLEGPYANERFTVDARANYGGGNPRLYRALDALLREQSSSN